MRILLKIFGVALLIQCGGERLRAQERLASDYRKYITPSGYLQFAADLGEFGGPHNRIPIKMLFESGGDPRHSEFPLGWCFPVIDSYAILRAVDQVEVMLPDGQIRKYRYNDSSGELLQYGEVIGSVHGDEIRIFSEVESREWLFKGGRISKQISNEEELRWIWKQGKLESITDGNSTSIKILRTGSGVNLSTVLTGENISKVVIQAIDPKYGDRKLSKISSISLGGDSLSIDQTDEGFSVDADGRTLNFSWNDGGLLEACGPFRVEFTHPSVELTVPGINLVGPKGERFELQVPFHSNERGTSTWYNDDGSRLVRHFVKTRDGSERLRKEEVFDAEGG